MLAFDPPKNIRKPKVFSVNQKGTFGRKNLTWQECTLQADLYISTDV